MFTEREIELVRTTWAPVSANPDAAAELFYTRLFETAPAVRPLFPEDMKLQGRKLMQMIGVAVHNMHRIDEVIPALIELGERHEGYGAEAAHYPVVGAVLLETLGAALGADFDDEARAAWSKTYDALAGVMQQGR